MRGFAELVKADLGFSPENVVTFRLPQPPDDLANAFGGEYAQLYGVSAADPVAYVSAAVTVAAAALLAVWLPIRRATRVNPAEVLRAE